MEIGREKGKKDDRGMALVMVLVAIALAMIMVGVLLSISLLNYRMKTTEIRAKDNFYSAEVALDQIHAGISQVVSDAAGYAYTRSIQTYKMDGITEHDRMVRFRTDYIVKVREALKSASLGEDYYELGGTGYPRDPSTGIYMQGLASYLDKYLAEKLETGTLTLSCSDGLCAMKTVADGLVLKNLLVGYTDAEGYYSEIRTDIAIGYPAVDLMEASVLPNVFDYSFIADRGLVFDQAVGAHFTESVYAGAEGIRLNGSRNVSFEDAQYVVSKGKLSVDNTSSLSVKGGSVWLNGIEALGSVSPGTGGSSSEIIVDANVYVTDDLTLSGQNPSVVLEGNYYGFGDGDAADKQSAMLLNCRNGALDLTGLNELLLGGNAFIGTESIDYTADEGAGFTAGHNRNVLMGNSLSVKADQIAYLAPAECLGTLDGAVAVGKNPMTADEYIRWSQTLPGRYDGDPGHVYRMLDEDRTVALLGRPLSDYFTAAGDHFQTVFRTSGSESLCYVYLKMNREEAAAYYRDYAAAGRDTLDRYAQKYNNSILVNTRVTDIKAVGNLVTYRLDGAGSLQVLANTVSEADSAYAEMEERRRELAETYKALCSKLTTNYDGLTETEKTRENVYLNLIKTEELDGLGGRKRYEAGGYVGIVTNEASVTVNQSRDRIKLVVTSGNVTVEGSFSGLIIAGGEIRLDPCAGAVISGDKYNVTKLLQASEAGTAGGDSLIAGYFINGEKYIFRESGDGGTGYVDLEGVIAFRNWSKQ